MDKKRKIILLLIFLISCMGPSSEGGIPGQFIRTVMTIIFAIVSVKTYTYLSKYFEHANVSTPKRVITFLAIGIVIFAAIYRLMILGEDSFALSYTFQLFIMEMSLGAVLCFIMALRELKRS